jgi:hypothetical protein
MNVGGVLTLGSFMCPESYVTFLLTSFVGWEKNTLLTSFFGQHQSFPKISSIQFQEKRDEFTYSNFSKSDSTSAAACAQLWPKCELITLPNCSF